MLPKENRLDLKRKFAFLKRKNLFFKSPYFVALYQPNNQDGLKIGFVLSKKQGGAVDRQRQRRLLSEAFRLNLKDFPGNLDLAVIGRTYLADKTYQEVEDQVKKLARFLQSSSPIS